MSQWVRAGCCPASDREKLPATDACANSAKSRTSPTHSGTPPPPVRGQARSEQAVEHTYVLLDMPPTSRRENNRSRDTSAPRPRMSRTNLAAEDGLDKLAERAHVQTSQ